MMKTTVVSSYAESVVEKDTNIFTPTQKTAFMNGLKFLGKPDGEFAALASKVISTFRVMVAMQPLNLPADAVISGFWIRVITRDGPGYLSPYFYDSTGMLMKILTVEIPANNTNWYLIPTTDIPVGYFSKVHMLWSKSSDVSNRMEIDAFEIVIEYSSPSTSGAGAGPTVKHYLNGTWAEVEARVFHSSEFRNFTV